MPELSINQGVEIRNAQLELHRFRVRLAVAFVLVLTVFALLVGRFFYLQVVKHDQLHTLAEANRISIVPVVPNPASSSIATARCSRTTIPPTRWRSSRGKSMIRTAPSTSCPAWSRLRRATGGASSG